MGFLITFSTREDKTVTSETASLDRDMHRLLEHCRNGFVRVTPLVQEMGRSRLYRRLERAVRRGLLLKEGARYMTSEVGLALLERREVDIPGDDPLVKAVPQLAVIGRVSPLHRAIAELVIAAAVARTNALRDAHHPSFVIVGERLRFKTWLAQACCATVGADDRLCVLHSVAETKGSMFRRRGKQGEVVSERKILTSSPICVVDEFQRAPDPVRGIMALVMHGQMTVPFENETATIRAVPIVVMNPLRESKDLVERTGLDEPLLRRSIVADLACVSIPPNVLPHGDAMLDEIRRMPPVRLDPPSDTSDPNMERIKEFVSCSIPMQELLADIDLALIGLLAVGMRSFIPDKEAALRRVLHDYLSILSTTGRTREGWEENLRLSGGMKAETSTQVSHAPNPFSWRENLAELARVLDERSIGPRELIQILKDIKDTKTLRVARDKLKATVDLLYKEREEFVIQLQQELARKARDTVIEEFLGRYGLTLKTFVYLVRAAERYGILRRR